MLPLVAVELLSLGFEVSNTHSLYVYPPVCAVVVPQAPFPSICSSSWVFSSSDRILKGNLLMEGRDDLVDLELELL